MNCSRTRLGCISGGIPVWNEWETLGQVAWKIEDMLEEVVPPMAAKRDRVSKTRGLFLQSITSFSAHRHHRRSASKIAEDDEWIRGNED